ncbi:MAG: hypothetical protein AAF911_08205 [Planctomycetota bacterium]
MSDTPATPHPGPTELYILAAGLLLGILLGPAALGRVAPIAHASLFGGGPATQQLIDYDEETAAMVAALQATGVTPAAIDEQIELRSLQRDAIAQAAQAVMDLRAFGWITLIGLALAVCLAGQAALGSSRRVWTVSAYALVALGLAVILARPSMLSQTLLWPWA